MIDQNKATLIHNRQAWESFCTDVIYATFVELQKQQVGVELFRHVNLPATSCFYVITFNGKRIFEIFFEQYDMKDTHTPTRLTNHIDAHIIYPTSPGLHKSLEGFERISSTNESSKK
jgi:hypothetical protein